MATSPPPPDGPAYSRDDKSKTCFFDLPRELRDMIYTLHVDDTGWVKFNRRLNGKLISPTPLRLVSRLVESEIQDFIDTVHGQVWATVEDGDFRPLADFIANLDDRRFQSLRRRSLHNRLVVWMRMRDWPPGMDARLGRWCRPFSTAGSRVAQLQFHYVARFPPDFPAGRGTQPARLMDAFRGVGDTFRALEHTPLLQRAWFVELRRMAVALRRGLILTIG